MQCCSEFDMQVFPLIQEVLENHFCAIDYKRVYIPSYCEPWVFASAKVPK